MTERSIDLASRRTVHVIGIGGSGMSAIAQVLHEMGHTVTGSDLASSGPLETLRELGVAAAVGHDAAQIGAAELVARSTAIPDSNPEIIEARSRGLDVLTRAEILAAISELRRTVAISGTHGKTTTSSMLAVIAEQAGTDPSYVIGGTVAGLGTGASWGTSDWFVVEADESDGTFVTLGHEIGVVTNVEPDHLEHYGGEKGLRAAFETFVEDAAIPILCSDDHGARALHRAGAVTYGEAPDADYRMIGLDRGPDSTRFGVTRSGELLGDVTVPIAGRHNALNALGAIVAADHMGIGFDQAVAGVAAFGGVARRFQSRGSTSGIDFVDDYAHLPTEVRAALEAAGDLGATRIVAVFQPHRYSRTEAVWRDFAGAFDRADVLIVGDIYSAGEAPRKGVSGRLIVEAVQSIPGAPPVRFVADRADLATAVAAELEPGDVCLTLGAGDLVDLPDELIDLLGADS